MTEEMGVHEEVVAEPQAEQIDNQPNDQEINWQRANETMAQQKRRLDELERANQMLQQQQMQTYQAQQQQARDPLAEIPDTDVLTGAEFKGAIQSVLQSERQQFDNRLEQTQRELANLRMRSQYSDYDQVTQNTLREAENDPELARAIASSSNPHLLAYRIGKQSMAAAEHKRSEAERVVRNAQKPGSASQATTGASTLSQAEHFLNMPDSDFEAHIAKVKRGL